MNPSIIKHLSITVTGKVQGVFYRANAQKKAIELNLKGFVRNQPNGDVFIEVEGNENSLAQFIEWCKKGPKEALVTNVELKENRIENYLDFNIQW